MKYSRIVSYIASQPWCILMSKMDEILEVVSHRAAGHIFTEDEIQARIGAASSGVSAPSGAGIAVIPLRGTIAHRMGGMDESSGGMSAERFTRMVQTATADPSIGSILIDVDSPGGTIPGVPEAADAVYQARETKKVVAIANSKMASAAYWIASQAHEIVSIPSVMEPSIGSIGVFAVHQDLSAALEKEGIKTTLISAGKFKTEGNPFEPLTEERKAHLQGAVDGAYKAFVNAVARGRGISAADVRSGFGEGRALSAVDAKAAGMIDRIGSVDETIARLANPRMRGQVGVKAEAVDGILEAIDNADADALSAEVVAHVNPDEDRARRLRII
jgi:signal peptide peptidase SppA